MAFSVRSVQKEGDGFKFSFKRDFEPRLVSSHLQRLRSGTSYYCQIFSDGTAKFGRYDANGKWEKVNPIVINDFFEFDGTTVLYHDFIVVNHDCIGITQQRMSWLKDKLFLNEICQQLLSSGNLEWRPAKGA